MQCNMHLNIQVSVDYCTVIVRLNNNCIVQTDHASCGYRTLVVTDYSLFKSLPALPSHTFSYLIKSFLITPLLLSSYPLLWVSGSWPQMLPINKHCLQFVFKTTKTHFKALLINDVISVNTSPPFVQVQKQQTSSDI